MKRLFLAALVALVLGGATDVMARRVMADIMDFIAMRVFSKDWE